MGYQVITYGPLTGAVDTPTKCSDLHLFKVGYMYHVYSTLTVTLIISGWVGGG